MRAVREKMPAEIRPKVGAVTIQWSQDCVRVR